MIGTGAGGRHGKARPLEVKLHADVACSSVVHQLWHNKGVNAVLSLFVDCAVIVIQRGHPAAGIAQDDPCPV